MPLIFKAKDSEPVQPPLNANEREVARVINSAAADLETAAVSPDVQAAISTEDVERVVAQFPWDSTAQTINQTALTFGQVTIAAIGGGFPSVGFQGRFDYTDPRATTYAQQQSATLVTNMTTQMQEVVRTVVGRAFTEKMTVWDTAKELRSVINLTARQEITLGKFTDLNRSRLMDEGLSGRKLEKKLDELVQRQYKKMISQRSKVIARNEILTAENNGRFLGFEQSIEQGWSSPTSVKRWSTSTDERTCSICMPMNGASVQWNEFFPNGVYQPPAHIQCRCSVSLLEPDSSLAQTRMPAGIIKE
jgi:SPP1 gp7 family putative phage head morphogenesis protein